MSCRAGVVHDQTAYPTRSTEPAMVSWGKVIGRNRCRGRDRIVGVQRLETWMEGTEKLRSPCCKADL